MNEREKPVVLSIQKGAKVTQGDREYVVTRVVDLDKVLAKELVSGELVVLSLNALEAPQKLKPTGLLEMRGDSSFDVHLPKPNVIEHLFGF